MVARLRHRTCSSRNGWRKDLLKVGDEIQLTGFAAKDGTPSVGVVGDSGVYRTAHPQHDAARSAQGTTSQVRSRGIAISALAVVGGGGGRLAGHAGGRPAARHRRRRPTRRPGRRAGSRTFDPPDGMIPYQPSALARRLRELLKTARPPIRWGEVLPSPACRDFTYLAVSVSNRPVGLKW